MRADGPGVRVGKVEPDRCAAVHRKHAIRDRRSCSARRRNTRGHSSTDAAGAKERKLESAGLVSAGPRGHADLSALRKGYSLLVASARADSTWAAFGEGGHLSTLRGR